MISPRTDTSKCLSELAALGYIDKDKLFSDNEKTRITDEYPFDTSDLIRAPDIPPNGVIREPGTPFIRAWSFEESPTETANRFSLDILNSILKFSVDDRPLQDLLTSGLWHRLHDDFSGTRAPALDNDEIEQSRGWYSFTIIDSQPEMAAIKEAYERRIDDLRGMAEDEGFTIASQSEVDFWKLIDSLSPRNEAQLVLSDEGNLIATWKDSSGNYFDIEFLGDNNLQYVVFKESCRQFNTTISGISDSIHEVQGYELRENSHTIRLDNENSGEGDSTIQDIKLYVQEYGQESLLGI